MSGDSGYTGSPPTERAGEAAPAPEVFTTVFHSGTGGSRVQVLADRIVTRDRIGHTSIIAFRDIAYAGPCESSWSPRAYGVYLVLRTPPYDTGYLFADAATRATFLAAIRARQVAEVPADPTPLLHLGQAAAQ